VRWVPGDAPGGTDDWARALGLLGPHNLQNARVARAVLEAVGVVAASDDEALRSAAAGFRGLDSRLQPIGAVDGVEFVDDGLSTNVLPALAALGAFAGRRVALLVGGYDRGIDYEPLGEGVARREEPTLVVTLPDSGPRIGRAVARHAGRRTEVIDCADLAAAVATAYAWARPDGVVLLSPAAPSFGRYADYRDRARAFAEAVRALRPEGSAPPG
jgi:UDP-N-acetylmuramoylalanine--D-glutamate ligase